MLQDGVARQLEHLALRRPDEEDLGLAGGVVAAGDRVDPLGAAEVLDRQRRCGPREDVRVCLHPAGAREVGHHVPRPRGEHEGPS